MKPEPLFGCLPLPMPLIISSFWGIVEATHFLLPAIHFDHLKPLYWLDGHCNVKITPSRVTEPVYTPAVMPSVTSSLGTSLLQCWPVRSAGLSGVQLREFCCNFVSYIWWFWACGGVVGWGTALQAGRSRVRFPIVSLELLG